jgi:transcriptional regulator with XRE-family HTH domain
MPAWHIPPADWLMDVLDRQRAMASRPRRSPRPAQRSPGSTRPVTEWEFERVAVELVKALRGRRSQVGFSRRLGYGSSAAHRWESKRSWPTACDFLTRAEALPIDLPAAYERFFHRRPQWLDEFAPGSMPAVAAFLRQLRGKTPINDIAAACGRNRYSVSRWFKGISSPKLPDFLCLIEVCSRRLLDFIETLVEPARLPALKDKWLQLQRMREVAYEAPWSHAILRALEIEHPTGDAVVPWLGRTLGISEQVVQQSLRLLHTSGQIHEREGEWSATRTMTVNTGHDPARANTLRVTWARLAVERMAAGLPGHCGYSLFAIGKRDLVRLRDLHVEYVRAMQDIIAASSRSECVALFCSQLFDLNPTASGAFAPR